MTRICLLGLDSLPVLADGYEQHRIGGESVQHALLAHALVQRGHEVGLVVRDLGQPDGVRWHRVAVHKAFASEAGWPLLRFAHPRATGLWAALDRADADLYYTSCAGMEIGLLAAFCRARGRACVFRTASDDDCVARPTLVRHARDRWLYRHGLRRSHAILVQSEQQARALRDHFGLPSRVAGMLVEPGAPAARRDIDLLWVANVRAVKCPDRMLALARALPAARTHIAGGMLPGEEALYRRIEQAAAGVAGLRFHGRLAYRATKALFGRARLLVNTSDLEGFPNTYLQAWANGVPVVALIDPDHLIESRGLGIAVRRPEELAAAAQRLLDDRGAWEAASARCLEFMAREHGADRVLRPYLETFEAALAAVAAQRTQAGLGRSAGRHA